MAKYAVYSSIFLLICFEFSTASTDNALEGSSKENNPWGVCEPYFDSLGETFEDMVHNGTILECYSKIENMFAMECTKEMNDDDSDEKWLMWMEKWEFSPSDVEKASEFTWIEKWESLSPDDKEYVEKCWEKIHAEVDKKTPVRPTKMCLDQMENSGCRSGEKDNN